MVGAQGFKSSSAYIVIDIDKRATSKEMTKSFTCFPWFHDLFVCSCSTTFSTEHLEFQLVNKRFLF